MGANDLPIGMERNIGRTEDLLLSSFNYLDYFGLLGVKMLDYY